MGGRKQDGGRKSQRELPSELADSEEAVAVWEAAKAASNKCQEQFVHGWRIEYKPRAHGTQPDGRKAGDMYVYPRRDALTVRSGCGATIRSLTGLREVLLRRKAALEASGTDDLSALPTLDAPAEKGWAAPGKRKRRCGVCPGCLATDCGACSACRDKPKFGGSGVRKQACVRRHCAQPSWPSLDGTATDPWLSGSVARKESRVGAEYQASLPRLILSSIAPPPAAPPLCPCSAGTVWARARWWCADELSGCLFEEYCPPVAQTPTCECGERAHWEARTEEWSCAKPPSAGGCTFRHTRTWAADADETERAQPVMLQQTELGKEHAQRTAAALTAAAYTEAGAADDPMLVRCHEAHTVHALSTACVRSSHCGACTVCGTQVRGLSDDEADDDDEVACERCASAEGADVLLLCDGPRCTAAFHIYCLSPPLERVPTGNWYCAACVDKRQAARTQTDQQATQPPAAQPKDLVAWPAAQDAAQGQERAVPALASGMTG
jgi:hypothetical protein